MSLVLYNEHAGFDEVCKQFTDHPDFHIDFLSILSALPLGL